MKGFLWWWHAKMNTTLACVFSAHGACTGQSSHHGRTGLCLCKCHYKL